MKLRFVLGFSWLLLAACSDAPGNPIVAAGKDASAGDGSVQDGSGSSDAAKDVTSGDSSSDAAPACNTVAFGGSALTEVAVNQDPPTLPGGPAPVDGAYDLTETYYYCGKGCTPGPNPQGTTQWTIEVSGTSWKEHVLIATKTTTTETYQNGKLGSVSGGSLPITWDCPSATTGTWNYETSGKTLRLANPAGFVHVFVRR